MTRRSIAAALSAVLIALTVALQSPAVRAYEPCDGQTDNRCTVTVAPAAGGAIMSADSNLTSLQRVCTLLMVGFPTCYTPQADGMWVREELADTDTNWVAVGTARFDEVAAAVGAIITEPAPQM